MEEEYDVNGFCIRDASPWITGYNVYASAGLLSASDEKWLPVVVDARFTQTQTLKRVDLEIPVKVRYIKLEIPVARQAGSSINIKEFEVYKAENDTKIESIQAAGRLVIYPNPATTDENLYLEGSGEVKIYTLQGLLVGNLNVNEGETISLSTLIPGIYIIELTDKTGYKRSQRLIVKSSGRV